jgi:hypothetical protein
VYTRCTGGDCEVECHNRLYTPFYSTEAQADYTLAHELGHIMLNTHNAAKAESKGLEIMTAANNTDDGYCSSIRRGSSILLRSSGISMRAMASVVMGETWIAWMS